MLLIILVPINLSFCFWPPPYKVDLNYEETFVIDEHLEKKDVEDVYEEEELLKKEDMQSLNIKPDDEKYFRIHQEMKNVEKDAKENENIKHNKVYKEGNPDLDEEVPWQAGFVDENGDINVRKVITRYV